MTQTRATIPYGKTVHGEAEIAAVVEVLRTSTQMGKNVREFERRVAALFAKPTASWSTPLVGEFFSPSPCCSCPRAAKSSRPC